MPQNTSENPMRIFFTLITGHKHGYKNNPYLFKNSPYLLILLLEVILNVPQTCHTKLVTSISLNTVRGTAAVL